MGGPAAAALLVVATDLIRFALHALLAALIFTGAVEVLGAGSAVALAAFAATLFVRDVWALRRLDRTGVV